MASGDTLLIFHAASSAVSKTTDASFDSRNHQLCLDFDATTNETARFQAIMPQQYAGSGVTVRTWWTMSTATTGDIDVDTQFERQSGGLDLDNDGFATAQSTDNTVVPSVSGEIFSVTNTHSNGAQMNNVVAGDPFRVQITRDAASDTATGDAELRMVEIREQ